MQRCRAPERFLMRLRREARAALAVLLLIVAAPSVHTVAEARAVEAGLGDIICTSFGAMRAAETPAGLPTAETAPVAAADDLPSCALCAVAGATPPAEAARPGLPPSRLAGRILPPISVSVFPDALISERPPARAPPRAA